MAAKKKKVVVKPAKRASKSAKRLLPDERKSLVRPPIEYAEVIGNAIEAWSTSGKALRVTDRSPAALKSMLRKATTAADREQKLQRVYEAKLGALTDARMVAQADAWKALLDLYAAVRAARGNEQIQEAFAFLADHFSKTRAGSGPAPVEPPTPT